MVELKTAAEIAAMREAGRVVARVLSEVRDSARVGDTLTDLDDVAWKVIRDAGGTSLFDGYHPHFSDSPFSGAICASVNDAVLHGPPGPARLADGDLVSIDCGVSIDGWCADAAVSFVVGTARARRPRADRHHRARTGRRHRRRPAGRTARRRRPRDR